ncbi:NAD-binding protein [Synechococcus lacustris]|uniref:NAD-binding protein n=1 Tax=Synechococcus lacustris TaxID=2116544 RepID=UPI0033411790
MDSINNQPVDSANEGILVCGLGALGQACLSSLMAFNLPIRCLDRKSPKWTDLALGRALAEVTFIGDMRNPESLLEAGVATARAVLLLSQDSGVNLEAALQVRLLNPKAQLVVRSSKGSSGLENQLQARLPGLVIVDPQLLTAGVFANALRPDGTEAAFDVEGELFVVRSIVQQQAASRDLFDQLGRMQRLVQWFPAGEAPAGPAASGWWNLDTKPAAGDRLLWLELASTLKTRPRYRHKRLSIWWAQLRLLWEGVCDALLRLQQRRNSLLAWGLISLLLLLLIGSFLFGAGSPLRGLMLTLALLKGEYLDAFSFIINGANSELTPAHFPLAALALIYALGGTLLTAWLVALILDRLLAARIGSQEPKPLAAATPYVLLLDGGLLATRLRQQLRLQKFQVVQVQSTGGEEKFQAEAYESLDRALKALRHCHCQAVGVLSDDLMANLSVALELQQKWPDVRLAVRSHSLSQSSNFNALFEGMQVINPLEVAADAVVATALGERVRGVLRLAEENLLIIDYKITSSDTLNGLSLGTVAGGYGLIPLVLIGYGAIKPIALPNPERILQPGDRLVVLAGLNALRQVEAGQLKKRCWMLEIRGMRPNAPIFDIQVALARYLGASPGEMAAYLDCKLAPQLTPSIYQVPGRLLEQALKRLGVNCELVPANHCD